MNSKKKTLKKYGKLNLCVQSFHLINIVHSIYFTFSIILQIVQEKSRFQNNTYNYAMKKTQLMKERDIAHAR